MWKNNKCLMGYYVDDNISDDNIQVMNVLFKKLVFLICK